MKRTCIFTAALLLCTASASCSRENPAEAARTSPAGSNPNGLISIPGDSPMLDRIRIASVDSRQMPLDVVSAPARIEADPGRRTRVRVPVPGRIAEIHVRPGETVRADQLLLTLESPEAEAVVAEYRQARAATRRARQDLERVTELHEFDAAPRREVIAAETELAQAEAELAQAERMLRLLRLDPDAPDQSLNVVAPIAGRVLTLDVSRGEFHGDPDEPIATVADLSVVWAVASVPEGALRLIQEQDEVSVTLFAWPDETFEGEVLRIADVIDPATRTVSVYVELENPDGRIRPQMFGTIELRGGARDVAAVPPGTVVYQGGAALVLVEAELGTFELRQVAPGPRSGDWIPVRDGLAPGERVVVDGTMLLLGHGNAR